MRIDDTLTTQDFDGCFDDQPDHIVSVDDVIARGQLVHRQTRRRTRTAVAASIAAVLAVSGVVGGWAISSGSITGPAGPPITAGPASPSATPSATPSSADEQGYLLPPDSPRRIAYGVDVSDPIGHPPSSTPVGKTEAIGIATRVRGGPKTDPPQAALREISSSRDSAFTAQPSHYWVVTWFFRGGRPSGGMKPGGYPSQDTWDEWANSRCVSVVMVNATTGRPAAGLTELCTRN